jgi:glycosyltransferase involved in cell wall biosynthesis
MKIPILSVLVDTYNHERYIEQAVVSAIEQDFPADDYEIVVVDDGSTDRTPDIVRKFRPRVRLLSKKNGGQASAFNAGLPELRGEIVAFLDGDDWFARSKLAAVIDALEQHPESSAVGHGFYEFCDGSNEVRVCSPEKQKLVDLSTPEAARQSYLGWLFLVTSALTVRKRVLDRLLPIPERLTFCADTPIAMASMADGVCLLPLVLSYYRRHGNSFQAVDLTDQVRMRRRAEIRELTFEFTESLLVSLGVRKDCVAELLYAHWIEHSRSNLRAFGGPRLRAFHTEIRSLRVEYRNPSLQYRLFKYLVVGGATLVLPPRQFYRLRDWYGRHNLGQVREQFARTQ